MPRNSAFPFFLYLKQIW